MRYQWYQIDRMRTIIEPGTAHNDKGMFMGFSFADVKISVPVETSKSPRDDSIRNSASYSYMMKDRHMRTLRKVRAGLHLSGAKLATGDVVNSNAKTLQWILEQIDTKSKVGK
jgi:hypothetical protein